MRGEGVADGLAGMKSLRQGKVLRQKMFAKRPGSSEPPSHLLPPGLPPAGPAAAREKKAMRSRLEIMKSFIPKGDIQFSIKW